MARESREQLMLKLGDLARERLGNGPAPSEAMLQVFDAEEGVLAAREALAATEDAMNRRDQAYRKYVSAVTQERAELTALVKTWKRVVAGVEGHTRDINKKLGVERSTLYLEQKGIARAEERFVQLEAKEHPGSEKLAAARDSIKKQRLLTMRRQRAIAELEQELEAALTPEEGHPGAEGILAHRRLLELENETVEMKQAFEADMAELEAALPAQEADLKEVEDSLDDAIYALGDECYQARLGDPVLAALYPLIDKAK